MSEVHATPDAVERTRQMAEAISDGDFDTAVSRFGPDAVWDMSPLDMGIFEGRAAIRGFLEDWWGAYEGLAFEVEDVFDFGNGVTFSVVMQRGRPAGSNAEVHQRSARVSLRVDGLIERITSYSDIDEARAAAERLAEERADG